jgi:hypothetical protein
LGDGDSELTETLRFFSSSFLSFSAGRAGDSDCFFAALRSLLTKIKAQYTKLLKDVKGNQVTCQCRCRWQAEIQLYPFLTLVPEAGA